jgi:hypothetical protein
MMPPAPTIVDDSSTVNNAEEDDSDGSGMPDKRSGRRKIKIEYINDKYRRHITFSKRKAGIMKKVTCNNNMMMISFSKSNYRLMN